MSDEDARRGRGRERFRSDRGYDGMEHGGRGGAHMRRGDRGGFRGGYRGGSDEDHDRRRPRDFDLEADRAAQRRRYEDEDVPPPKRKTAGNKDQEDEEPVTFREFLLRQRDDISPEEAKAKYDEYVKEIRKRQPNVFFDEHKAEEWFRERYHPAAVRARYKKIKQEAEERAKEFAAKIAQGGHEVFKILVDEPDVKDHGGAENGRGKATTDDGAKEQGAAEEAGEDGAKAAKQENGEVAEESAKPQEAAVMDTVFLRNIPPKVTRAQLEAALTCDSKYKLVQLRIGDVQPTRGLSRLAWAKYATPDAAHAACEELRGKSIKEDAAEGNGEKEPEVLYKFEPVMNRERDRRNSKYFVLPKIMASAARLAHDTEQVEKVMRYIDKYRETDKHNPLTAEFLETLEDPTRRLDLCVHYLFKVHYYSYYAGAEFMEDTAMQPPLPVRPKIDPNVEIALSASGEKGNWERKVDDRVELVMARKNDVPKSGASDGGALQSKKVQEWLEANTRIEGEGRCRCALPPYKLFKGVEYVHKHLRLRHTGAMEKVIQEADEAQFLENYLSDPNRLDGTSVQEQPPAPIGRSPRGYSGPGRGPGPGPGYHGNWGRGGMPPMIRTRGRGMPMQMPMNMGNQDPRANRVTRYNDLDQPAEGPNIQLVKFEER